MAVVLTDFSPAALEYALRKNLMGFFAYLERSPAVEFVATPTMLRWRTKIPHPWFNGVIARLGPNQDAPVEIRSTQTYFSTQGVNTITWWIHPDLSGVEWDAHLLAQGFYIDDSTPGMAVELAQVQPDDYFVSGLQIKVVKDPVELESWTQTFIAGYELPAAWGNEFFLLLDGLGYDFPVRNYLGYLNGQPVGTSTLFLSAGVAGVMNVATLPQARGQGIGAALTAAPLLEARALGYRAGILQSSEMGYRVYERMGFRKICTMEHYYWQKPAPPRMK